MALNRVRLSKLTIALVSLALVCGFCFGVVFGQQSVEPEIITEYVIVYEEGEEVVREVVKEVPIELRQFESWHELQVWQANNYITDVKPGECVDTARELYYKATADGFEMSYETWGDGLREGHEICATWINGEKYFLEPSGTMSWLAGIKK